MELSENEIVILKMKIQEIVQGAQNGAQAAEQIASLFVDMTEENLKKILEADRVRAIKPIKDKIGQMKAQLQELENLERKLSRENLNNQP